MATPSAEALERAYAFFNQYCSACRQEAPQLRAWAQRASAHYRILGVGFQETTSDAQRFARSIDLPFEAVGDPAGTLAARLHVSIPTIIVLVGRHIRRENYATWKTSGHAAGFDHRSLLKTRPKTCRVNRRGRLVRTACSKPKPRICHRRVRHRNVRVRCAEHATKKTKPNQNPMSAKPKIIPHPSYTSEYDFRNELGGRMLLIRYLRPGGEAGVDQAFAAGAAADPGNGIHSVAIMCAGTQTAPPLLEQAGISAPVTVDTGGDCVSRLDGQLDGIATGEGGPERLLLPSGRPVASELNVVSTLKAFNLDPMYAATPAVVRNWMNIPASEADFSVPGEPRALAVPTASNIVRSSTAIPAGGDAIVQGFWYLCPTCVAQESDFHLNEWASTHPGKRVYGFTCDQDVAEDSAYIYEHGWAFPVIVYQGPLSFGACFDSIQKGELGDEFYAATSYIESGQPSQRDVNCEFPDFPDEWGGSCQTGQWSPSPEDPIAPFEHQVYSQWAAAGGQ
jgi:hypothetical protein